MKKSDELRQEKAALVAQARAIADKAKTEKREMNTEETTQFNKIMDVSLGEKDTQIRDLEAGERRMQALADVEGSLKESRGRQSTPNNLGGEQEPTEIRYNVGRGVHKRERVIKLPTGSALHAKAFRNALLRNLNTLSDDERRALQLDNDTTGGFLQGPQTFIAQLIATVDNLCFVRGMANVLSPLVKSGSYGIPERTADVADTDWTAELLTGSEDSTLAFGKRELKPHPMGKSIKISKTLLGGAGIDPEAIVRDRLAYKKAITEEQAYLTGSGAAQPLGVFTASNQGISTARDVSSGNTSTAIGADNLINVKYSLKGQYWSKASWVFHRDALKQIAKLKDSYGQYLWRTGLAAGDPDTILNMPIAMSEYAPNTFTTGLYVGLLGDFSHYWIGDSLDFQIQILLELYAATNQNGYIMRSATDGAPVLEEAFARVTLT